MSRLACAAFVALTLAATGCVSVQAKGDQAGPALAPPLPPPHAITPVEIDPGPPAAPADPGPTPVIVRPSPKPPASKPDKSADKSAEKPEGAPAADAPSTPAGGLAPAPLQTTANVTEVERNIRERMAKAWRDLDRTDYRVLTAERREQYDTAKRFIRQAEDALKVKNLVFAEQLADKAATLAAALAQK